MEGGTHLHFDLTLAPILIAYRSVAPALHEVSRARAARELEVRRERGLLCQCELRAGLGRRRRAPERVRFPL